MSNPAIEYARSHREEHLRQLLELLAIPSVSTLPEHEADVRRAAEWVADQMKAIGLQEVRVYPTEGHPVVYGHWLGAADAPTVLIYGHYDVQPADPLEEWETPPFEPTIRDGNIYARGASDDKGQFLTHLKSVEAYLRSVGALPVNVKFMIEGEEEIGSPHLAHFVRDHQDLLRADLALISDSAILGPDQPSIVYGLRGLAYLEMEVTGPDHDLHSGTFGGAVRNPAEALCNIIAALKDDQGRIRIPGFYDDVRPLSEEERATLAQVPFDEAAFRERAGIKQTWGEAGYSVIEQISARPTLDVNGIWGGFTGNGSKTIIPARAAAKISMRLVPDQQPERVFQLFKEYVEAIAPPEVTVEVRYLNGIEASIIDRDIPEMKAASKAYEQVWGKAPVFTREGGSIPVVSMITHTLGIPTILMGFGLPDDRLHSPNEKFAIENFYKGIETSIRFLEAL
jgi:acetylornithine deacetylase/succinyl-diaminopimelate desuccinylase-like protein